MTGHSDPWAKHLPPGGEKPGAKAPPPTTKEDEAPLQITLAGEAARLVREHARHHELTTDEVVVVAVATACFDYRAFSTTLRFSRAFKGERR